MNNLSAAAQRGIRTMREMLIAAPPPGVTSHDIEQFFARHEGSLIAKLHQLLQDHAGAEIVELGPSEGPKEESHVPYWHRKLSMALPYEAVVALGKKKEVRLLVRDRRDKAIVYRFTLHPIEDGVLVTSAQTSTRVHITGSPTSGDMQRALLKANPASSNGEIFTVVVPSDLPPSAEGSVEAPKMNVIVPRPKGASEATLLLDYSLLVFGVFGRKRTSQQLVKKILDDVPRSSPKTLEELLPTIREILEKERVRSDAKIVVKEWKKERSALGIDTVELGGSRELLRGAAKDVL